MNFESEVPDDTDQNLVDLAQATTSQDNSSSLSYTDDASRLHTEQNKNKRSISKCQGQTSSDTSIEKSDESLSKRQKLNESVCNTSEKQEETKDEDETNKKVPYLKLREKSSNWHIVPEVINRQIGSNPLFKRRFYSSLYAVERFQLMYKLYPCALDDKIIDILNFNHKGNLLMYAINNEISIWDWAKGKESFIFPIDDDIFVLDAKWLPLDNYVAFSSTDNGICLLDIESDMSTKLLMQNERFYKLAVHPETPHVILSTGTNSKVLSIDIRESKPKELLEVKENSLNVLLSSIDSNPSNSNEFCVAGHSYCVMAYDRRKVSEPLYKLWPYDVDNDEFVTSATYNYNGTEILASYNSKGLFLFDKLITPLHGDYGHMYQNVFDGIFFGPKSEYIVARSYHNISIWKKNSESVIQYIRGDRRSVTCLESHPHIPILATSGFDDNVKLWVSSKGELSVMGSVGKVRI
ncbi:DDB1- and CUL4-associated factor 8 [Trachymyrmex septentrionalis]|uniref:DDB1-and CUL4-associated factor 8 n=1 Tax=Trachymyrmex septentrionalis TaxID=34720 RepID=A0A151JSW5_9HYME|nr:DDB1- and CUL4-associated factor 8 [Trachymyrmex septentrionalis]